jgi:hypothetical protein
MYTSFKGSNKFQELASRGHHHSSDCDTFLHRINVSEATKKLCDEYRTVILGDAIPDSSPYIYPFIIEFALIGAAVAYIMSDHIGKRWLQLYSIAKSQDVEDLAKSLHYKTL